MAKTIYYVVYLKVKITSFYIKITGRKCLIFFFKYLKKNVFANKVFFQVDGIILKTDNKGPQF